jgi:hypothetical protein
MKATNELEFSESFESAKASKGYWEIFPPTKIL